MPKNEKLNNELGEANINTTDSTFYDFEEDEVEEKRYTPPTLAEKCVDFLKEWPLPKLIAFFEDYIGGQTEAVKAFSMAFREHIALAANPGLGLKKSNCLIYGPTGSGKTELFRVAKLISPVPVAIEDAASITPSGFRGYNKKDLLSSLQERFGTELRYAIVFLDEFDKLCHSDDEVVNGFRVAAQQDLLKMVEGETVTLSSSRRSSIFPSSDNTVVTDDIMFVCGGTFDGAFTVEADSAELPRRPIGFTADFSSAQEAAEVRSASKAVNEPRDLNEAVDALIRFGMIPEFAGRLNHVIHIRPLSEEALYDIITKKANSSLENLKRVFRAAYDIELKFTEKALREACRKAHERHLGARGLSAILDDAAHRALFHASGATLVVDAA